MAVEESSLNGYSTLCPSGNEYLPHPYPLHRLTNNGNLRGGFMSSLDPEPRSTCFSYGEWWQKRQPLDKSPGPKVDKKATSYWPYGPQVSVITGSEQKTDGYWLDKRWLSNTSPSKGPIRTAGMSSSVLKDSNFRRSSSAADLMASAYEQEVGLRRSYRQQPLFSDRPSSQASTCSASRQYLKPEFQIPRRPSLS
eukprot:TRINITY_DN35883_c1_g1_i1.p1 TRINITY_DN35883_c1_g1~~TRINITY_DN35883_c1_g1_i1.p1  ORF type:complete len:195 (+),score=28.15 TRINITY_DN35883_c1_g1_i1:92-676(+)